MTANLPPDGASAAPGHAAAPLGWVEADAPLPDSTEMQWPVIVPRPSGGVPTGSAVTVVLRPALGGVSLMILDSGLIRAT